MLIAGAFRLNVGTLCSIRPAQWKHFFILISVLLAIYIAYKETLNVAHKRWLAELDLFKKRLAVYDQLKLAVGRLGARDEVTPADCQRFAQAMSEMQFLFDQDVERFVGDIYGALLKKQALDRLLEKAASNGMAPNDRALINKALARSAELSDFNTQGIYFEMPKRMQKFMRHRPISQPAVDKFIMPFQA